MSSLAGRVAIAWLLACASLFVVLFVLDRSTADAATAAAVGTILVVPLYAFVRNRLDRPLAQLQVLANQLAEGDAELRSRSRRLDEIGSLGRAIDRMADRLHDRLALVRAEETRLRVMLDAMEEPVLVTDRRGVITLSNAAFEAFSGAAPLGKSISESVRSGELHDAVQDALRNGRTVHVTFDARGVRPSTLSSHVAPLPDRAGVVVVMHDVTELRKLDSIRRDFVANASHELRTPLTAIRGFAETLRDGALEDSKIAARFVQGIVENSMRLSRLVDDLLELSRSESPDARFESTTVDGREAAARVLSALEGKAAERGVTLILEADGDLHVRADEGALDQVLLNLVENGIKYTPRGGSVQVRLRHADSDVIFEVTDTGPGISASHQRRIFERFYRADAGRSREQGGTGLGLSIVKHLTTRMQGDVRVESTLGRGSTFFVKLPAAEVS